MSSLSNAIDDLAGLFEYGHLEAASDPVAFVRTATAEIKMLRARIAELEAERDEWIARHAKAAARLCDPVFIQVAEAEGLARGARIKRDQAIAERDRLRAVVEDIAVAVQKATITIGRMGIERALRAALEDKS